MKRNIPDELLRVDPPGGEGEEGAEQPAETPAEGGDTSAAE